jgi:hypothetical protein
MKRFGRYVLPLVAGASLVVGMVAVSPMVASAKKACTVPTGCGKIKLSPKKVTTSGTGTTITVKGSGFTPNDTGVNLVECKVGAETQGSCDLTTAMAVTVSAKGTFTGTISFLTTTFSDADGDSCVPVGKATLKTCGVAAGNVTMTDDAGPVAVSIKNPKAPK